LEIKQRDLSRERLIEGSPISTSIVSPQEGDRGLQNKSHIPLHEHLFDGRFLAGAVFFDGDVKAVALFSKRQAVQTICMTGADHADLLMFAIDISPKRDIYALQECLAGCKR
jgi:hypothetical protein